MNPFKDAIDSTRRESAVYSASKIKQYISDIENNVSKRQGFTGPEKKGPIAVAASAGLNADEDPRLTKEQEVFSLLNRLHDLVGDFDRSSVLKKLHFTSDRRYLPEVFEDNQGRQS